MGWVRRRWLDNFLKADRCLGLVKCYSCFDFNWNFWKFNYFSHFFNFNLSLRNYRLREQKIFYICGIYDCFSVSRYINRHNWIFRHTFMYNPHWLSNGFIIFSNKYYIVVSDKLVGPFLDVLFLFLPVILSEIHEKPRRKDLVATKST